MLNTYEIIDTDSDESLKPTKRQRYRTRTTEDILTEEDELDEPVLVTTTLAMTMNMDSKEELNTSPTSLFVTSSGTTVKLTSVTTPLSTTTKSSTTIMPTSRPIITTNSTTKSINVTYRTSTLRPISSTTVIPSIFSNATAMSTYFSDYFNVSAFSSAYFTISPYAGYFTLSVVSLTNFTVINPFEIFNTTFYPTAPTNFSSVIETTTTRTLAGNSTMLTNNNPNVVSSSRETFK